MDYTPGDTVATPARRAGAYLFVGAVWILSSSYLLSTAVGSPAGVAQLHVVANGVFVVLSGGLLYWVSRRDNQRVEVTTEELQQTLQQTHVLHRILRHNLRNKCNVILGQANHLSGGDSDDAADTIRRNANDLLEVSEQCRVLREVSLGERPATEVDLADAVADAIDELEATGVDAEINRSLPHTASVSAHPAIEHAIREVILNAIEHGEGAVDVRVDTDTEGRIFVEVTDQGSGFPEMERRVLRDGFIETQTHHSQGIGLWIVRTLLNASDGTLAVESPGQETTVRLTFQPAVSAAIEEFLQ